MEIGEYTQVISVEDEMYKMKKPAKADCGRCGTLHAS